MNYGFIIDNRKCIGCHACTVACKAEHNVPIGVNRTWVKYIEKGNFPDTRRFFSVMRCNHCEDAPCVDICPVTALYTRSDGIVDFDKRRCIGCRACMQACPYDALYIDPDSHTAAKCNYCAHRVEVGLEPSCVVVCPEEAIIAGDLDNPASEISELLALEQVTVRKAEKGTSPKVFYIDGDQVSLNPTATAQSERYLWSSQATGVGHSSKQLHAGDWLDGEDTTRVLVPDSKDIGMRRKARDVLKEVTRRVYDAPKERMVWGWEVGAYIFTKAIAAGTFLIPFFAGAFGPGAPSTTTQTTNIWLALFFLLITTGLLVKDLDQPLRFAYVLLRPQWKSWLVRGGYAIALYGLLLTLRLAFEPPGLAGLLLNWITMPFALVTAIYTAFLFAQAKGRDFWQSSLQPLHMLVHAIMAGAALNLMLSYFMPDNQNWASFVRDILAIALALNLALISLELATPHATHDAMMTVKSIIRGRYRNLFWLGGIGLGSLLPLIMIAAGEVLDFTGALLSLLGIYVIEHIWVSAPQRVPLS